MPSVTQLKSRINEEYAAANNYAAAAMGHAIKCGEYLMQAKAKVKHGEWMPWCKENIGKSQKQISLYMKVAEHKNILPQGKIYSLKEAVEYINRRLPPKGAGTSQGGNIPPKNAGSRSKSTSRPKAATKPPTSRAEAWDIICGNLTCKTVPALRKIVRRNLTDEGIQGLRKIMLHYSHPDKGGSAEDFKLVTKAFEYLGY